MCIWPVWKHPSGSSSVWSVQFEKGSLIAELQWCLGAWLWSLCSKLWTNSAESLPEELMTLTDKTKVGGGNNPGKTDYSPHMCQDRSMSLCKQEPVTQKQGGASQSFEHNPIVWATPKFIQQLHTPGYLWFAGHKSKLRPPIGGCSI